mgnify:CR=1 FL=1|jgi:hypothetical protein|tara:strand:+ start:363 stop:1730 length:1368 start_codon:yes stop_codon:yes gene_type:complete
MSYTSPRYTYISKQSAFDQLRQDATQAGKTIADKQATADKLKRAEDERKRKINESRLALGRGATQKYLNTVIQNSTGSEFEKGAISEYFKGTGKTVGELTMRTQGPSPVCQDEGTCDADMEELAKLLQLPAQVKTLTENMLDQLDYSDIKNIDPNQPGNYFLAANILKGATGTDPASGYSYSLRKNEETGGTEWVFKFDEAKARESFKNAQPPMSEEEINDQIEAMKFDGGKYEFAINSEGLESQTRNGGSLFIDTPEITSDINEVYADTQLFGGIKFDDKGNLVPNSGNFDMSRFLKGVKPYYIYDDNGKKILSYEGVVDKDKIANDAAFNIQIKRKIEEYLKPENSGEMTALWNMTLSGHSYDWDENEIAKEMGFETPEDMRAAWDYGEITPKMQEAFKKYYKQYMVDDAAKLMNSSSFQQHRRTSDIRNLGFANQDTDFIIEGNDPIYDAGE